MATIMPQSELVRRAFAFVAEAKDSAKGNNLTALLDEAAMRFNLSPLEAESLQRLFTADKDAPSGNSE